MSFYRENDDYEPLTWVRGHPIYATTLIALLHVVMLVVISLTAASGSQALENALGFRSSALLEGGQFWRLVTYYLLEPMPFSPIFFALQLFLLYIFGREVEKYLGHRRFLVLIGLLIVTPPLLLTLAGPWASTTLVGSLSVHFALFIAFATLYPGVEFFLRIQARWLAWAFLGLYTLFFLSQARWAMLCAFLGNAVVAWLFIAVLRDQIDLGGWLRARRQRPARPVFSEPDHPSRHTVSRRAATSTPEEEIDPVAAIDPLLDKIATHGLASLTKEERARLEEAREALLNRSSSR